MTQIGQDIIDLYKPYRDPHFNWKTVTISKQKFEIPARYDVIDVSINFDILVGQGAYGIVVAAKDN
jgi:hypothetical protein